MDPYMARINSPVETRISKAMDPVVIRSVPISMSMYSCCLRRRTVRQKLDSRCIEIQGMWSADCFACWSGVIAGKGGQRLWWSSPHWPKESCRRHQKHENKHILRRWAKWLVLRKGESVRPGHRRSSFSLRRNDLQVWCLPSRRDLSGWLTVWGKEYLSCWKCTWVGWLLPVWSWKQSKYICWLMRSLGNSGWGRTGRQWRYPGQTDTWHRKSLRWGRAKCGFCRA